MQDHVPAWLISLTILAAILAPTLLAAYFFEERRRPGALAVITAQPALGATLLCHENGFFKLATSRPAPGPVKACPSAAVG